METQKKILIADDEAINVDFFEVMLSKLGYIVEKTEDGSEVINKVRKFRPDLILLDNIMPGMTGWEITKIIKSDPDLHQTSIIMISALDDVKDKVAGFEAGVDDYITKPFNFSEVLARINSVLRRNELFAQIAVRETRLDMAEELNKDLKENLTFFIKSIDELDNAVNMITKYDKEINKEMLSGLLTPVNEKLITVRKHIAALDARIEKTISEWDNLKKDEIGLSVLKNQIHKAIHTREASL